jgi:hypothetical protein
MYAKNYALITIDYALFAPEEVIFDSAASKSVFKSLNLLTNVAPSVSRIVLGVSNKVPREHTSTQQHQHQ